MAQQMSDHLSQGKIAAWEHREAILVPAALLATLVLLVTFLVIHPSTSNAVFESLFAKTFAILGYQLLLTYLSSMVVVNYAKHLHAVGSDAVVAHPRKTGDLKLVHAIPGIVYGLLIVDVILFIALLVIGVSAPRIGIAIFGLWSMVTGFQLGLSILTVHENLGSAALAITALLTVGCGVIGISSKFNFAPLGRVLFFLLLLLLLVNIVRAFRRIDSGTRVTAAFGSFVFVGYLLFDFNRLSHLQKAGANSWSTAMSLALDVYLDIINLFLQLLELLGESK